MDLKDIIINESNCWFDRNRDFLGEDKIPYGTKIVGDFIAGYNEEYTHRINSVLEVGCSFGYNLKYLSDRCEVKAYGIDPSDKAIQFGNERYNDSGIKLQQMLSNDLSFSDVFFDVVIIGFSFYITPRSFLFQGVSEADRVLKPGGFLCITDFDVPGKMQRTNVHNELLPVYKEDYAQLFLNNGYSLLEKRTYTHNGYSFDPDIQERVSTQILYKEQLEDIYFKS